MEQSTVALIIVGVALVSFATEIIPLSITAVGACVAMVMTNILTFTEAFSGLSSPTMMLGIGMGIMANGMMDCGLANKVGIFIISKFKTERPFMTVVFLTSAFLSAFLSNFAVTATFMGLISAIAIKSEGRITRKNCFFALLLGSVLGGSCTLVGSTPNISVQAIMEATPGVTPMTFFTLAPGGVIIVLFTAILLNTVYYPLAKRFFAFEDVPYEGNLPEMDIPWNRDMTISCISMAWCIINFVGGWINIGITAIVAGMITVIFKVVDRKTFWKGVEWEALIIMGAAIGFANGVNISGAGKIISDFIINLFGGIDTASPVILLTAIMVAGTILTNIMSNTAVGVMLAPIAIMTAQSVGAKPETFAIGVIMCAGFSFATPIATASATLIMSAGYKFRHYLIVGGTLTVLIMIFSCIVLPLVYGL